MKKKLLIFLFIFPVLVLACLVLYRKQHGAIGGQGGIMPSGVAFITGDALHRSNDVWTNRNFITTRETDEAFQAIETLASSLPVSENVKSNATRTCIEIIKAYGRGDWDAFLSVRVPFPDYDINRQAAEALEREAKRSNITINSKLTTENVLDVYHRFWKYLVYTNGLFSEISFITNSITIVETSPNYLPEVATPSFTVNTNQNYFTLSPRSILDYSTKFSQQKNQKIKALRFFFFGKEEGKCDFYMFVFALDEQNAIWIPWCLSVGHTDAPLRRLPIF